MDELVSQTVIVLSEAAGKMGVFCTKRPGDLEKYSNPENSD